MRDADNVPLVGAGSVAALPQLLDKRIDVRGENTVEQPALGRGVKGSERVHDGLRKWGRHSR